jgi:2-methylcitrate dehydratase PrpD
MVKRPSQMTRREVLENVGRVVAVAAFAPLPTAAQTETARQPVGRVMATLSTYMSEAKNRPLPDAVLERAKRHTLDTLAAMVSGADLVPGRAALRFANAYGGSRVSTVVASTIVCGTIEAALVNGVLAHSDETDDSWPSGWHPGCAVVPAALAVGEQFGISGSHLLRAIALGYDIGSRFWITLRAAGPQSFKSSHSLAGVWGAAAAAGSAAALTAEQMRWLIDYTAQQASGVASWSRDSEHIEKGFTFGGMPARSGVTSALLVHAGWTGVDDVLSGENNYLLANAPGADPARLPEELLIEQLGERYEVARTNLKKWTVGSPIQAPLDALEIMLKQRPFDADQVREVVVRMAPGNVVDNRDMPDVNIQHMIAVMLIDKTATFQSAHDVARMKDPATLRERAKVRLVAGEGRGGAGGRPLVRVTLTDGTTLSEDVTAVLGTVENPMTRDQVIAKSRSLMSPILGAAATSRLIDTVLTLEQVKDVRRLRPLLQRQNIPNRKSTRSRPVS